MWVRKRPWLLDLGHLNWLLPSGRDNFSAAENLTAVSAYSRLPPSSRPWARRCCLPSALSFTSFLYFHVSLHPLSPLQILTVFPSLSLSTPTHSYTLLGFSNRPVPWPCLSQWAWSKPEGNRGDFILLWNSQNASDMNPLHMLSALSFFFFICRLNCCKLPLTGQSPVLPIPVYPSPHRTQSQLSESEIWSCHF